MSDKQDELQPIIIKKVVKGGGGHHGGAWKVAYADFVTAMMAFFLLLWLLNVTTKEQKAGIADYFNPTPKISRSDSGAGGLMGGLSISKEGAMVTVQQPIAPPQSTSEPALRHGEVSKKVKDKLRAAERKKFEEKKKEINKAIAANPNLKELSKHVMIDVTPEGLRIQIIDQDGRSMFPSGSADMHDYAEELLQQVAEAIESLPNEISIRGHTDSTQYAAGATYTNWELSTDRANATRRVLKNSGLSEERLNDVVGKADTDHLYPEDPRDARNRRMSMVLLSEEITNPDFGNVSEEEALLIIKDDVNGKKESIMDKIKFLDDGSLDEEAMMQEMNDDAVIENYGDKYDEIEAAPLPDDGQVIDFDTLAPPLSSDPEPSFEDLYQEEPVVPAEPPSMPVEEPVMEKSTPEAAPVPEAEAEEVLSFDEIEAPIKAEEPVTEQPETTEPAVPSFDNLEDLDELLEQNPDAVEFP